MPPFVPAFGFPNCGPGLSILPALHRAESLEAKVSLKAVVGGVGELPWLSQLLSTFSTPWRVTLRHHV